MSRVGPRILAPAAAGHSTVPVRSDVSEEAQVPREDDESWACGGGSVGGTSMERAELVEPGWDLALLAPKSMFFSPN